MSGIPTVNLTSFLQGSDVEQQEIANDVDEICRTLGFLIIEKHGVPQEIIDDAWTSARAFFDLPTEQKMRSEPPYVGCPRGYFPFESEALAKSLGVDTPPDVKESLSIGPLRGPDREITPQQFEFHYGDNIWPTQPPKLQSAFTT